MVKSKVENLEKILDFLKIVENLKSTLRYNKTTSGRRESSADHSWRLALMVFAVADELGIKIDILKSIKIALVHDLAEAITGDIDAILIAEGKVSKVHKQNQEEKAMCKIINALPNKLANEVDDLWQEYKENTTREAKFIKALDKIETLVQLVETGHEIYDKPELIPNYADSAVSDFPELIELLIRIKTRLKGEYLKGKIKWKKGYGLLN
jgi:putative hydrolases of HD superfamily